jgi:hypothetical protein
MTSIHSFLLKPLGQQVRNFQVIQIREREMGIAANTDLGQMHDGYLTTVPI